MKRCKLRRRIDKHLGKGTWKNLSMGQKLEMIALGAHKVWKLIKKKELIIGAAT